MYQENDNYGMNVLEYFDQYQNAPTSSPLYKNGLRFYPAGQFEYDDLIAQAEAKVARVEAAAAVSPLPDRPNLERVEQVLVAMRKAWYS